MFPSFQHMSNEVRFQVPSTPYQQRDLHIPSDRKQPRLKRLYNSNNNQQDHDEDNEKKKKKMEHRKIEKKRRQEMSNLSSSLRSLLPLHFIKGRQSMSEHINQAVTYINHLQENVKVLNTKRDELKKTCIHITDSSVVLKTNMKHASVSDCSRKLMTVIVGCSHGGITILIKSYYTKKEAFPISRVMKALLQEGLDIISCNSTQVNDRLIYSIESEVIDETTCIQVSLLQKKLTELVNTDSLIAPPFMDI